MLAVIFDSTPRSVQNTQSTVGRAARLTQQSIGLEGSRTGGRVTSARSRKRLPVPAGLNRSAQEQLVLSLVRR